MLELAEESILVDPFHRMMRTEVGETVLDASETGFVVAFRFEPPDLITFLAFLEVTDDP